MFDTTRTFNGRIFKLQEHLDRFFNSLKYLRMEPGLSKQEFADITMQVLEAKPAAAGGEGGDYWVTQRITRGVPGGSPTVLVECVPLPFEAAREALSRRDACHRAVDPAHAAGVDEPTREDAQLHQPRAGDAGGGGAEPGRVAYFAGYAAATCARVRARTSSW